MKLLYIIGFTKNNDWVRLFLRLLLNAFSIMQPPTEETVPEEKTSTATDILTPEEEEKLEPVIDSLPSKPRELSEDDLVEIMQGMVDRMQNIDLEQEQRMKEFAEKETNKNLIFFVLISLLSIVSLLYVHYHIGIHNNLNLTFLLYIVGFLAIRTVVMFMAYKYLIDYSTDDCINMANRIFSIISILTCLSCIFVLGTIGYIDGILLSYCFPYMLMEGIIIIKYLAPCGGRSSYY